MAYSRNESITINASSQVISDAKQRKGFIIRNVSTAGQTICLALSDGKQAENGSGIVLNVNDYFADNSSEGYECWQGSIQAISSAIGGSLAILER